MNFGVKYSRDCYGIWKQEIISPSKDGEVLYLDNLVSDKEFGNTISRFEHGDPKCMCYGDHPNPKPHVFFSKYQIEAINQRLQETRN